ncbi:2OG-Fe(II) oxygenase [Xylariaceae sp. FL0804]|nr:2OG-Fe(II) oxygenase [Xylariaceae sp. FL0804]
MATTTIPSPPPDSAVPASPTSSAPAPATTSLRLWSGNGPVRRTVLRAPLRDASPDEVPVIDAAGITSPLPAERARVAREVRAAAQESGFFYLRDGDEDGGGGIVAGCVAAAEAARKHVLDFFRQPAALKEPAAGVRSRCFNGWRGPRSQSINPFEGVDVRETFSWAYDPRYDPAVADPAAIPPEAARFLSFEDFHWEATAHLPGFKDAIVAYWRACLALARALVRTFALSLDLPEDFFNAKFEYPDAALALNYYPPLIAPSSRATGSAQEEEEKEEQQKKEEEEQEEVSIGSHTDFQLFTILWQDATGGLEVLSRGGQWLRAPPVPGSVVVNIGDYFQRITNDRYVSTVHRARNHHSHNHNHNHNRSGGGGGSRGERVSMPFFFGFGRRESCAVLDGCVAPGETPRYDEISCEDWVRKRAQAMMMMTHQADDDDDAAS